jgi:hypothetical protein
MSYVSTLSGPHSSRSAKNIALIGAVFLVALGTNIAAARTTKTHVDPRAMQANADMAFFTARACQPANGAQILGGFAGSGDFVNVRTGEICGK